MPLLRGCGAGVAVLSYHDLADVAALAADHYGTGGGVVDAYALEIEVLYGGVVAGGLDVGDGAGTVNEFDGLCLAALAVLLGIYVKYAGLGDGDGRSVVEVEAVAVVSIGLGSLEGCIGFHKLVPDVGIGMREVDGH